MQEIQGKKIVYTLRNKIGQGSQGHVYVAIGDNQVHYALKFQNQMSSDEEEFLNKIIEEQSSQKLIKIHEIVIQGQDKIIVQDLYKSQNIKQLIWNMNKEEVFFLIQQVGEQLEYIHSSGYIFLDLKPENIIWRQNNQGQKEFKICDFGSIKKFRLIQSPDSYQKKQINYSNDIWSFGALIFELHKKQQLFDDLKEITDYFSNSTKISDQVGLLDISNYEKIFLSLMLEKKQDLRPSIQQVNQFYKSTQLEQITQLLTLWDLNKQFTEQIIEKMKIELGSKYGCDQFQYANQNYADKIQNRLIPSQSSIQQKQIQQQQKEMQENYDRPPSNLEEYCIKIQLAYYRNNNEESKKHPKIINCAQKGNYQTVTNFEEIVNLIFELQRISQKQKIVLHDFVKNYKNLNKLEDLIRENSQKQTLIQQKKNELNVQKEELDKQSNEFTQMKNQIDSQKAELSELKKNEKKMALQIKEYEKLKKIEQEMNNQETAYKNLIKLKHQVENNKPNFEQLKKLQKTLEIEILQYQKLMELEQQVMDKRDQYIQLKQKETQMKLDLDDYKNLQKMQNQVQSQNEHYNQLLKQKENFIQINTKYDYVKCSKENDDLKQQSKDQQEENKKQKLKIKELEEEIKKLETKNQALQKDNNEMNAIKVSNVMKDSDLRKQQVNTNQVNEKQETQKEKPNIIYRNGRKIPAPSNVNTNQVSQLISQRQQSRQNQIQTHHNQHRKVKPLGQ